MYTAIRVARFVNIEKVAMRKLAMLERAANIADLRAPPNNRLERQKAIDKDNTASVSMINGASALSGPGMTPSASKL